jgi:hypothetical protein
MSNQLNFGDFVRAELKKPDSTISQCTKKLRNWKYLVAINKGKRYHYTIEWEKLIFNPRMVLKYFCGPHRSSYYMADDMAGETTVRDCREESN